jgi:hypothetical protein
LTQGGLSKAKWVNLFFASRELLVRARAELSRIGYKNKKVLAASLTSEFLAPPLQPKHQRGISHPGKARKLRSSHAATIILGKQRLGGV